MTPLTRVCMGEIIEWACRAGKRVENGPIAITLSLMIIYYHPSSYVSNYLPIEKACYPITCIGKGLGVKSVWMYVE